MGYVQKSNVKNEGETETEEVTTHETVEAVDSSETTDETTIETVEVTGIVRSVTTQTLHSDKSATDAVNLEAEVVVDILTGMTEETTAVMTVRVDGLTETTDETTIETVEVTGIVQSVTTQTSHSDKSATDAVNLVVEEVVIEVATTSAIQVEETKVDTTEIHAEAATTVVEVEKFSTTTIGNAPSVTTQTLHSDKSATDAKHHARVGEVAADEATILADDPHDETIEDVQVTAADEATILADDPHDETTVDAQVTAADEATILADDLHDEMTVDVQVTAADEATILASDLRVEMTPEEDLLSTTKVGALPVEMGEVDKPKVVSSVPMIQEMALTSEGMTVMNDHRSEKAANLENLESPVEKALATLTIDHQNHLDIVTEKIEGELHGC